MKRMIMIHQFFYKDLWKDFNLYIDKNKFTTISGPNNCGKTTLMRILNRDIITDNMILIDEKDINDYSIGEFSSTVQGVFPLEIIFQEKTVEEEIALYNINREEVGEIIKGLNISSTVKKQVKNLTVEEIVLVQIALALLKKPKIVLLDNIHPYLKERTKEVLEFLKKYQEKYELTMVQTTIHLEDSLPTDALYIFENGMIALEGKPIEVLENDTRINKIGLELPFMMDLSVKLRDYDLIDTIELDKERLVDSLWQ